MTCWDAEKKTDRQSAVTCDCTNKQHVSPYFHALSDSLLLTTQIDPLNFRSMVLQPPKSLQKLQLLLLPSLCFFLQLSQLLQDPHIPRTIEEEYGAPINSQHGHHDPHIFIITKYSESSWSGNQKAVTPRHMMRVQHLDLVESNEPHLFTPHK